MDAASRLRLALLPQTRRVQGPRGPEDALTSAGLQLALGGFGIKCRSGRKES